MLSWVETVVAVMDPLSVLGLVGNSELDAIAEQVREKLRRVVEAL